MGAGEAMAFTVAVSHSLSLSPSLSYSLIHARTHSSKQPQIHIRTHSLIYTHTHKYKHTHMPTYYLYLFLSFSQKSIRPDFFILFSRLTGLIQSTSLQLFCFVISLAVVTRALKLMCLGRTFKQVLVPNDCSL